MKSTNFLLFLMNMFLCGFIFGYYHYTYPQVEHLDTLMVLCLICIALFHHHIHNSMKGKDETHE